MVTPKELPIPVVGGGPASMVGAPASGSKAWVATANGVAQVCPPSVLEVASVLSRSSPDAFFWPLALVYQLTTMSPLPSIAAVGKSWNVEAEEGGAMAEVA